MCRYGFWKVLKKRLLVPSGIWDESSRVLWAAVRRVPLNASTTPPALIGFCVHHRRHRPAIPTLMVDFLVWANGSPSKRSYSEKKGRISFQTPSFFGTVPLAIDTFVPNQLLPNASWTTLTLPSLGYWLGILHILISPLTLCTPL